MTTLGQRISEQYAGKRVLILGWGREGQSSYAFLQTHCPSAQLAVSDQNQSGVEEWQSTHETLQVIPYLSRLNEFDVIFKTPGIPLRSAELETFTRNGGVITSQLNEFLHAYRKQTIGVTGTKGKSTTSSVIAAFAQSSGKHTLLAGNIGTPVFDIDDQITAETQLVIEMSSYQLESVSASPHIAVFLNFFPEHLNYHRTLENYFAAKASITRYQTAEDIFVFNQDVPEILALSRTTDAQLIPFSYQSPASSSLVREVLKDLDSLDLPATIKSKNILPALMVAEQLGLSIAQVVTALTTFEPLPHRLQTVSHAHTFTWIDDTLATIPEATIAALEALGHVDVLLLGGYDRGISYQKIVDAVIEKKVGAIAFFKPSGQTMYDLLRERYPEERWPQMRVIETMEDAVRFAYEHAPRGGVVLLSPSSPSFGQFKNYEDKSAQFRHWIEQLSENYRD